MNEIYEAVNNLTLMSKTLEKIANSPENYNTYYAEYLEQYSWELYKMSKELTQIGYAFGGN
jgi:hypothetical protein